MAFDRKPISLKQIIVFTPHILFQSNVFIYVFVVTVLTEVCDFFMVFTFGIPLWLFLNIRVTIFESVCGAADKAELNKEEIVL
jgi:hypothetical protein